VPKIVPVLVADEGARAPARSSAERRFSWPSAAPSPMRDGRCRVDHLRHDHGLLLTV